MKRPDGLTDYEDLTPLQQAQARDWCASMSILTAKDAEDMAFRIAKTGRISRSYKDKAPSTKREAALDAALRKDAGRGLSNDEKVSGTARVVESAPFIDVMFGKGRPIL